MGWSALLHSVVEQPLRAMAGLVAEGLGQLPGLSRPLRVLSHRRWGVDDGRGHGRQLGSDVHDPSQEGSVALGAGLPACHTVERGTGQLTAGALDEPHMRGQLPVVGI